MKQKDTKLLWGRAANRCSICRCELSGEASSVQLAYPIGEQAHIVAAEADGPRGSSPLAPEDRESYHNMILLCPTHHSEIDKNVSDWPIQRLHVQKSKHELWVRETLAETTDPVRLAKQVAVTYVIDSAVELLCLENWQGWTQVALSPAPFWPGAMPDQAFEFRQRVGAAIWPSDFDELRRATETLSIYFNAAAQNFRKHARFDGTHYSSIRFHKEGGFNPNYERDLERYNAWIDRGYRLLHQTTAAANWFADVVRRDVNPMFFAKSGKFFVIEGPFMDFSMRAKLYELRSEERANLPGTLTEDDA